MPYVPADKLESFSAQLLRAANASVEESTRVAASLVNANLRGYDSHGVMRIPFYVQAIERGEVVPGAELEVMRESPTHLACKAHWGFGQVQADRLLEQLKSRCVNHGVAVGTMSHSGHIGRLGEYCETAAADGFVSIVMVNSHGAVVRVAPPGGKAPRLSTNPLAIGVPHVDQPLVLDFSTSATAEGKVRVKKIAGEPCPEGWLIDSEGQPTTDASKLYEDPPGAILPMGGAQAYKGFGLGLMIEILTGALSGGRCGWEPFYEKKGNCVFMMLVEPGHFGGREHFQKEVSAVVEFMRACPRVEGVERIVLPGDPERDVLQQRIAEGVFLDEKNWKQLIDLAERLSVTPPA